ncbi:hypothetical protein MMC20_007746 [Loxospora ochrophaea]|nr:hypothetical protein [Loxospora ochrophaea]
MDPTSNVLVPKGLSASDPVESFFDMNLYLNDTTPESSDSTERQRQTLTPESSDPEEPQPQISTPEEETVPQVSAWLTFDSASPIDNTNDAAGEDQTADELLEETEAWIRSINPPEIPGPNNLQIQNPTQQPTYLALAPPSHSYATRWPAYTLADQHMGLAPAAQPYATAQYPPVHRQQAVYGVDSFGGELPPYPNGYTHFPYPAAPPLYPTSNTSFFNEQLQQPTLNSYNSLPYPTAPSLSPNSNTSYFNEQLQQPPPNGYTYPQAPLTPSPLTPAHTAPMTRHPYTYPPASTNHYPPPSSYSRPLRRLAPAPTASHPHQLAPPTRPRRRQEAARVSTPRENPPQTNNTQHRTLPPELIAQGNIIPSRRPPPPPPPLQQLPARPTTTMEMAGRISPGLAPPTHQAEPNLVPEPELAPVLATPPPTPAPTGSNPTATATASNRRTVSTRTTGSTIWRNETTASMRANRFPGSGEYQGAEPSLRWRRNGPKRRRTG